MLVLQCYVKVFLEFLLIIYSSKHTVFCSCKCVITIKENVMRKKVVNALKFGFTFDFLVSRFVPPFLPGFYPCFNKHRVFFEI